MGAAWRGCLPLKAKSKAIFPLKPTGAAFRRLTNKDLKPTGAAYGRYFSFLSFSFV